MEAINKWNGTILTYSGISGQLDCNACPMMKIAMDQYCSKKDATDDGWQCFYVLDVVDKSFPLRRYITGLCEHNCHIFLMSNRVHCYNS
jgi:hypothetical protein